MALSKHGPRLTVVFLTFSVLAQRRGGLLSAVTDAIFPGGKLTAPIVLRGARLAGGVLSQTKDPPPGPRWGHMAEAKWARDFFFPH